MSDTKQGKVKWFKPSKGYGFISTEGDKDVFLHISDLRRSGIETVNEGDVLSFQLGTDGKTGKEKATNVSFANLAA
jgi:CspA family cold shock protein